MDSFKFQAPLQEYSNNLWKYHVKVPSSVVMEFQNQKIKRLLCTINSTEQIHASLMPAGEDVYFIKINSTILKKLKVKLGDELDITLEADESKYGMPLDPEMQELLENDPEGSDYFHRLTPGKQRSLLYLVNNVKSSSKKLEKGFIIIEHLKEQRGKLDFKILQQDFKNKKGII